jgi:glucuronate isomerase
MTIADVEPAESDALLGSEPAVREIARELHHGVVDLPIISPHGHVDAGMLARDESFRDAAALLVTPDHYVTRLLHSHGVGLDELGIGSDADGREVWRRLARHWFAFLGTPVRYWIEQELRETFGIVERLDEETADDLYDRINEMLRREEFRPLALLERYRIEILATTDDPAADLSFHDSLRTLTATRVIPTFRADRYMDARAPGWTAALTSLESASGTDCQTYLGLLRALRVRREAFIRAGATSTDSGVVDAWATPLSDIEAERLHADALRGALSPAGAEAYRRNMLYRLAEMSADDGLVMQLHAGVIRNHHAPTFARYGADTGHDLPRTTEFTEPLRELLDRFGTAPDFRLVLFTVDETSFSRDIAPLAGFYPTVYAGAPWWFLDAPQAIGRYRAAVTETAGFYKTSGFIDDTRALCSIPVRHDMSRRLDAVYLASRVLEGQMTMAQAEAVITDLTSSIPRAVFRL